MPKPGFNMFLHVVFSTKHQEPLISPAIEPLLNAQIAKVLYDICYSPAETIGGSDEHVHILLCQSRLWSIDNLVETIKTESSKWLRTQGEAFALFEWQEGYAAFTVSRSEVPEVSKYIARQREFHKTTPYKREFVTFLEEHDIEYEEDGLWD